MNALSNVSRRTWMVVGAATVAVVAVVVVLVVTLGGDDDTPAGGTASIGNSTTPVGLADQLGCSDSFAADTTDELYVEAVGTCEVGGSEVRLLTFANDAARDQFVAMAEQFGSRYVTGPGFAVEVDGPETEQAVKDGL